jgi:hypothetical protein
MISLAFFTIYGIQNFRNYRLIRKVSPRGGVKNRISHRWYLFACIRRCSGFLAFRGYLR